MGSQYIFIYYYYQLSSYYMSEEPKIKTKIIFDKWEKARLEHEERARIFYEKLRKEEEGRKREGGRSLGVLSLL